MLKKLPNIITLKTLSIFAAAFLLGIIINSFTGNYGINFSVEKNFTRSEAQALIKQRVECRCMKTPLSGTVISQQTDETDKKRTISVEWDTPLMGKFKSSDQDKKFFEQCMTIIE